MPVPNGHRIGNFRECFLPCTKSHQNHTDEAICGTNAVVPSFEVRLVESHEGFHVTLFRPALSFLSGNSITPSSRGFSNFLSLLRYLRFNNASFQNATGFSSSSIKVYSEPERVLENSLCRYALLKDGISLLTPAQEYSAKAVIPRQYSSKCGESSSHNVHSSPKIPFSIDDSANAFIFSILLK